LRDRTEREGLIQMRERCIQKRDRETTKDIMRADISEKNKRHRGKCESEEIK
jgi:hypothetical protein